jgi:hypothetical protein
MQREQNCVKHASLLLSLSVLMACANAHQAKQTPTPHVSSGRVFWSAQTGALGVDAISGDTQVPWERPAPKYLTVDFTDVAKAALLRKLVETRNILPKATIESVADGEYYDLGSLEPIRYVIVNRGHPPETRAVVTFKIGIFHLRCGPPTCNSPKSI